MKRLSNDEIFMGMAIIAAGGSTCRRRAVGCVLTNRRNHIIAVGRNGTPRGVPHCLDHPCGGESYSTGTGLDKCMSTHAEANALLQCYDVDDIYTAYITVSPCIHCVKLLMNTGCHRVVFLAEYNDQPARRLWLSVQPRSWEPIHGFSFLESVSSEVMRVRDDALTDNEGKKVTDEDSAEVRG
jgi:dCMP deaminase